MFKNQNRLIFLIIVFATFCVQDVFADGYSMTVSTGGPQSIDVVLGSDSKGTSISEDNITVHTTCRYGYNLTIGTTVNDNNLYLNGDSSNNASGTYISPLSSPTALSEATNSWGYYFNRSATPTASSTFSPVPASGNASVITELTTPSSSNISDSFSVYYGVTVTQPATPTAGAYIVPGTYKMIEDNNHNDGAIIYYFTMANNCIPYTIQFSPTSTSTGSSISGTGTMPSQEGYKDVPITLSTMSYTPPSGYEFKEWNTAQDGTGTSYDNEELITNIATPGSSITLYAIWHQPRYLYNEVAKLNRGTLAENNITMTDLITTPTSTNKNEDTSNSGVFTYDPDIYGIASDASNDYPIYFYRGILETNPSTSGSVGSANAYPNYVKLNNNTCWRIIRTTGSGGVKMIYSGTYGASISGSCANSAHNTAASTYINFNYSLDYHNKHAVGYTYNSSMNQVTSYTSVNTIFGSDSDPTLNDTRSTVKQYIEDTWYANNMTDYTDILEASAGYCNDRTVYDSSSNPVNSLAPYSTSSSWSEYRFGAYVRNDTNDSPSLNCPRSTVDLYRYVQNSDGLANELKYPVALMTADEQFMAGSGKSSVTTDYSRAFLSPNSGYSSGGGGGLLTLSPHNIWGNAARVFGLYADGDRWGYNSATQTDKSTAVRPVVSLIHQIYVASGSGTATDPWLITTEDPDGPINLYNAVAKQSISTQTAANLNSTISKTNSGVYEYDSSVFGADSDGVKQDNTKATIYYYRGILDDTTGTYGSDGDGEAWPNYVVLASSKRLLSTSDTCWRIVRTTGSGGVKLIYNGKWNETCANATTNAQISSLSRFSGESSNDTIARQIVRVGYTYSSTYASTTQTGQVQFNTVFGENTASSASSVNNTNSTIKNTIETWFNNNLSNFASIMESNAGYCNDRYAFTSSTGNTATTSIRPYTTSTSNQSTGPTYVAYFAGYQRNASTARTPSLGCSYTGSNNSLRNIVDLYSTNASLGGNGQLGAPVALLTADEASFAGSGNSNSAANGSYYNANSFLRTGSNFWTMTPYYRYGTRYQNKLAYNFYIGTNGAIAGNRIDTEYGVRPIVSLKEGTEAVSGSGTATDPWVVVAP